MTAEYRSEAEALADALPPPTARFDLPGGESTSAALHRAEQERDNARDAFALAEELRLKDHTELVSVRQERDEALAKRDEAIENAEWWRRELHRTEADLVSARSELAAARRRITELETDHG